MKPKGTPQYTERFLGAGRVKVGGRLTIAISALARNLSTAGFL